MLFSLLNSSFGILFLILCVILLMQVVYMILVFGKLAVYKPAKVEFYKEDGVSVIVVAQNNLNFLQENLNYLLHQDYSNYEVIVVNDWSGDGTKDWLKQMQELYKHLKVVEIPLDFVKEHGKKLALTLGIKAATNDILIFTDPNCKPNSKNWIRLIQKNYNPDTEMVLSYSSYSKDSGLLNSLIRYDNFFAGIQYISWALKKKAYKGTGRNLSYRKSTYLQNKGFSNYMHIPSGDADLFIKEVSTKTNTKLELHPDAFTLASPKTAFKDWLKYKRTRLSSNAYYSGFHKFVSFFYISTFYLFHALLTFLAINLFEIPLLASVLLIRWLIQILIFGTCARKLSEKSFSWQVPFWEILLMFVLPFFLFYKKEKYAKKWH